MSDRVLLIEDEADIRSNLAELLSMEGYDVIEAENGKTGLSLTKACVPDIVLCDIMMPGIDGYGVLSAMRADEKLADIPFLVLTAKGDRNHIRHGMNLGADDYLVKPISREDLLGSVRNKLQRRRAALERQRRQMDLIRTEVASNLPHEMLTPLNGIIGFASIMMDGKISEDEVREMATMIYESGNRLTRTIHRFFQYAELQILASAGGRASADRGEISMLPTDIAIPAKEAAQQFGREEDLDVHLDSAEIFMDSGHCHLAVTELVENAFKFSPLGSRVELNGRIQKEIYHLDISDRGRGMTTNQISEVAAFRQFDRFRQEQQGTGLGLVIVRLITRLSGGEMTVSSIMDQGTTVTLKLPIRRES